MTNILLNIFLNVVFNYFNQHLRTQKTFRKIQIDHSDLCFDLIYLGEIRYASVEPFVAVCCMLHLNLHPS